ncbi:hypothetical protein [Streptomyces chartreusis]
MPSITRTACIRPRADTEQPVHQPVERAHRQRRVPGAAVVAPVEVVQQRLVGGDAAKSRRGSW